MKNAYFLFRQFFVGIGIWFQTMKWIGRLMFQDEKKPAINSNNLWKDASIQMGQHMRGVIIFAIFQSENESLTCTT